MQINPVFDRLAAHLRECNRRYPQAWRQIDRLRSVRDQLGGWPEWCFCPLSGAHAVVAEQKGVRVEVLNKTHGLEAMADAARVGALSAWRVSQGVYAIDADVRAAVMGTHVDGAIPVEVLLRLPEWCCYIPTPGHHFDGGDLFASRDIAGFFAHLEEDTHDRRVELRLLLDLDNQHQPFASWNGQVLSDDTPWDRLSPDVLHLKRGGTIEDGWRGVLAEMRKNYSRERYEKADQYRAIEAQSEVYAKRLLKPIISLLLYLCSESAEYREGVRREFGRPSNPSPRKIKEGWRLFPPDRPRIWMVGERIGDAIRRGQQVAREWESGQRLGPRPHVRRAHWHSFWSGPRSGQRKISLKWLPPIPVAMEDDTPEGRMRAARMKPVRNVETEMTATNAALEGRRDDNSTTGD